MSCDVSIAVSPDELQNAFGPENVSLLILGLRDSVGEEHHQITRL